MRVRQQFEADLQRLDENVRRMGDATAVMLEIALRALAAGDEALARTVEPADDEVDRLDLEIEAECMRLVIQQQPVANDLRIVGMIFQAITDIERIADHAVDIAKLALAITADRKQELPVDIGALGRMVTAMFSNAMRAYAEHNLELVAVVIAADDAVDELFHQQRAALLERMRTTPGESRLATNLIFAAQFLERIGDRSVNIVERVHQIEVGSRP